jgi:tetratricopeptide (TPR) repeat protein
LRRLEIKPGPVPRSCIVHGKYRKRNDNASGAVVAIGFARGDPACAMCYWGEALVLGPNTNAPMFPEAVAPAVAAAARAVQRDRLADARKDWPTAIESYREAVAIQDARPYTAALPVLPGSPVAGLLRAGRPNEAEDVLRASLARTPSNGWAISALMEVYRERGDRPALAAARKRFETTWLGKPSGPAWSAL